MIRGFTTECGAKACAPLSYSANEDFEFMDAKAIAKKHGQIIRDSLAQFGTVRDPVLTSGISVIEQGIMDAINEDRNIAAAQARVAKEERDAILNNLKEKPC